MKIVVVIISMLLVGTAAAAQGPEGRWLTEKKGAIVEITRCTDGLLCGKLVWFRQPAPEKNPEALDLNNPSPERRNRPLCGLTILYGFKPAGPGAWEGGTVYDPRDGNAYDATMRLEPDGSLHLRGYIGISLIGSSETWTRYDQNPPQCPER